MKYFPTLLKPTLLGFINRWQTNEKTNQERGRDLLLLSLSVAIFIAIFQVTRWSLKQANEISSFATLPALQPLSAALLLLFFMLLTSNIAAALVIMYLGKDLDRVVASPLSLWRIFCGKFVHICLVSSWMPFLFLIPFLLAFSVTYDRTLLFLSYIPLILFPYMIIPTAIGIIIATLVSILLPARRTALAKLLLAGLLIAVGTAVILLIRTALSTINGPSEVTRLIRFLTLPGTLWIPSRWAAILFDNVINQAPSTSTPELVLLYSTALWTAALAYIFFELLFPLAYSNTQVEPDGRANHSPKLERALRRLLTPLGNPHRAMLLKEFRSVVRDISHIFEVLMLGGMCGIYLTNLQSFTVLDNIPIDKRESWIISIFVLNLTMNAFLVTALCTRFVFPSMSREGSAYWIVATAPLSHKLLLQTKRTCWLLPVCLIGVSFVLISSLMLRLNPILILITCVSSLCICYGVVSGAIGLGSAYAITDAEHPSQVSGGIGSFLFMLFACLLIFSNLGPIWLLSLYSKLGEAGGDSVQLLLFGSLSLILVALINRAAAKWALQQGEKALAKQMS